MSAQVQLDMSEFQRAMKQYAKVSTADGATILNRWAGDVAVKAIKETVAAKKTKAGTGNYAPGKGKQYRQRLHYAKAATKGAKKGTSADGGTPMRDAAMKSYNRARSSVGYHKAGWLNAAADFGKRVRSRPVPGLDAAKGFGRKARRSSLIAIITNFAQMQNAKSGVDSTGMQLKALQRAINTVVRERKEYVRRKLGITAKKFSGRRR